MKRYVGKDSCQKRRKTRNPISKCVPQWHKRLSFVIVFKGMLPSMPKGEIVDNIVVIDVKGVQE